MLKIEGLKFGHSGDVVFASYGTGETALIVEQPDTGARVGVLTVNIEEWGAPRAKADEVWLKTWSENTGTFEACVRAGIVAPEPVMRLKGGYNGECEAVLCRLTLKAIAAMPAGFGRIDHAGQ